MCLKEMKFYWPTSNESKESKAFANKYYLKIPKDFCYLYAPNMIYEINKWINLNITKEIKEIEYFKILKFGYKSLFFLRQDFPMKISIYKSESAFVSTLCNSIPLDRFQ